MYSANYLDVEFDNFSVQSDFWAPFLWLLLNNLGFVLLPSPSLAWGPVPEQGDALGGDCSCCQLWGRLEHFPPWHPSHSCHCCLQVYSQHSVKLSALQKGNTSPEIAKAPVLYSVCSWARMELVTRSSSLLKFKIGAHCSGSFGPICSECCINVFYYDSEEIFWLENRCNGDNALLKASLLKIQKWFFLTQRACVATQTHWILKGREVNFIIPEKQSTFFWISLYCSPWNLVALTGHSSRIYLG